MDENHSLNKDELVVKKVQDSNEGKPTKWAVVRKYNAKFSCEEAIRKIIEIHEDMEEIVDV